MPTFAQFLDLGHLLVAAVAALTTYLGAHAASRKNDAATEDAIRKVVREELAPLEGRVLALETRTGATVAPQRAALAAK